jgi:UDP-3-O-[3-hydroxymyristoyl] glucosamine N-acyltransferase
MTKFIKSKIKNVTFGKNVTIIEPVNLYGCFVGDNSFIGPYVEIQNNSYIGNNCKIQSHTFICENVIIKDNCFIGHGVMFTNDKFLKNKIIKNKNFF